MRKTILLTGATDGIGLETAKMLVAGGHQVLLHGRNPAKLIDVESAFTGENNPGRVESYVADLSRMAQVAALATAVIEKHDKLDVLINNAGIFKTPEPVTADGLDVLCGWLPRCKDFLTTWRPNRVRSCVRPVDAVFLNRWP